MTNEGTFYRGLADALTERIDARGWSSALLPLDEAECSGRDGRARLSVWFRGDPARDAIVDLNFCGSSPFIHCGDGLPYAAPD